MAGKVKTWVWVVVGIAALGIMFVIASAAVGFYFVSRHMDATKVSEAQAGGEFETVRARFAGQKPLIELDARGHLVRSNTDRAIPANAAVPEKLYIMAFDPDDGGLVKISLPFWLLRMKTGNARIDLSGQRVDLEDLKLTVEDLERFGPTLIVDQQNEGGDRVLVWTQ